MQLKMKKLLIALTFCFAGLSNGTHTLKLLLFISHYPLLSPRPIYRLVSTVLQMLQMLLKRDD